MVIIFDLDGTLIDSSKSIINSLRFVFKAHNLSPSIELTKDLIGPPLRTTVETAFGRDNPKIIDSLILQFKKHYDSKGFLETKVFDGIDELLKKLSKLNIEMFLVTNKRKIPTQKIINHLSWNKYFTKALSSDSFDECLKTKSEVLKILIKGHSLANEEIIYIGDTQADLLATIDARIDFIFVEWGYGSIDLDKLNVFASNPGELFEIIYEIKKNGTI